MITATDVETEVRRAVAANDLRYAEMLLNDNKLALSNSVRAELMTLIRLARK